MRKLSGMEERYPQEAMVTGVGAIIRMTREAGAGGFRGIIHLT